MHLLHLLHLIVDLVDESSNFFHLIQPGTPVVSLWHQSPNPCMLAPRHGELDTHPPEKALHEEAISVHRDRNILLRCCPALYGFLKNPIIYYLSKYFFFFKREKNTYSSQFCQAILHPSDRLVSCQDNSSGSAAGSSCHCPVAEGRREATLLRTSADDWGG